MDGRFNLDNQLCFRLYTASRLITQTYHPLLSVYGLTYPQYLVLLVLWEKDAQPVNDIAKRLLLETNTVTPLLKRGAFRKSFPMCRKPWGNPSCVTALPLQASPAFSGCWTALSIN